MESLQFDTYPVVNAFNRWNNLKFDVHDTHLMTTFI